METPNDVSNELFSIHRRIDEFIPLNQKVDTYRSEEFWRIRNLDFFPEKLLEAIDGLKIQMSEFIKGGYSIELCKEHRSEFPFYRKFALQLTKHQNFIDAFLATRSWRNEIAQSIAKSLFLIECIEKKRIPVLKNQIEKSRIAHRIQNAILTEGFSFYSDLTWETFLRRIYGKYWDQMAEMLKDINIDTIIDAFPYENVNNSESNQEDDPENIWTSFFNAWGQEKIIILFLLCQNGFFVSQGIVSWHDLLFNFLNKEEIQSSKYRYSRSLYRTHPLNSLFFDFMDSHKFESIQRRFQTKKGLDIVKRDIVLFQELLGRTPTQFDFAYILNFIENKYWKKYGIETWEDLIQQCFPSKKSKP